MMTSSDSQEFASGEHLTHQQVENELRFLLELTHAVNSAKNFDEALYVTLEALCVQERRIYGEVWLPEDDEQLHLSAVHYLDQSQEHQAIIAFREQSQSLKIARGAGLVGQAWDKGTLIWIEDVQTETPANFLRLEAAKQANLHAALAIPIIADENIVSILVLFKNVPNKKDDRFLTLAVAAATQLTWVLQGKQAQASLQQANEELEQRVARRTAELAASNDVLWEQIAERRQAQRQLRRVTRRLFQTQENERYRFSRALHDEAGQALTGLKIHVEMSVRMLEAIQAEIQNEALLELRKQLLTAVELCQSTMDQLRLLAHSLRPAALDKLGLNTALQSFCQNFAQQTKLDIRYEGVKTPRLSDEIEIGLYRFLQEALTNVARHAEASRVEVTLQYEESQRFVQLCVADDGVGFFPTDAFLSESDADEEAGIGLPGMKERIETIGGRLTIASTIGAGSRLTAWIPLRK